eukprot:172492-Chlamydomonas_euryale.AAC.7
MRASRVRPRCLDPTRLLALRTAWIAVAPAGLSKGSAVLAEEGRAATTSRRFGGCRLHLHTRCEARRVGETTNAGECGRPASRLGLGRDRCRNRGLKTIGSGFSGACARAGGRGPAGPSRRAAVHRVRQ